MKKVTMMLAVGLLSTQLMAQTAGKEQNTVPSPPSPPPTEEIAPPPPPPVPPVIEEVAPPPPPPPAPPKKVKHAKKAKVPAAVKEEKITS